MQTNVTTPPSPPGRWLMGHFREFNADKLGVATRYAREFGEVVAIRLGPLRALLVSNPALIEEVLVTRAKEFGKGYIEQLVKPAAGNGIFLSEGDHWKRQRRMAQPPFHRQRLAGYGAVMVQTATQVTDGWRDGEVRDIYPDATKIGLAVAAKTLFGVDPEKDADGLAHALTTMMAAVAARINAPVPLPAFVPTPTMRRLKRSTEVLDRLLYRAIDERRKNPIEREDLLSLLLAARDEDDGTGMTDLELRDEAMTLFIAGFETTAINLSWIVHLLSTHPEVDSKLRAEVSSVLNGRAATMEDLKELKFVGHVVNEALRLYPPAWAMDRLPIADLDLGGYRVRRGTDVWLSPWVMHRDPRFWDAPERFNPDRWEGDLQKRLPKFAFFPFGGGPRVCIGNQFALMESTLVLATLVQRFRFTATGGAPPVPEPGFTLRPTPGVTVKIHREN